MKIIIYEDDHQFRKDFCIRIENIKQEQNLEGLQIVLETDSEEEILQYLSSLSEKVLFFIDHYDAEDKQKGIPLATKIFESDPEHVVVFVSSYYSEIEYNIDMKTKAMCTISKQSPCFDDEVKKVLVDYVNIFKKENIVLSNDVSSIFYSVNAREVYAIETIKDTNTVVIKKENGEIQTYATLDKLMKELDHNFYRISRSAIVNLAKVTHFNRPTGLIELADKSEYIVPYRNRKEFSNVYSLYTGRTV